MLLPQVRARISTCAQKHALAHMRTRGDAQSTLLQAHVGKHACLYAPTRAEVHAHACTHACAHARWQGSSHTHMVTNGRTNAHPLECSRGRALLFTCTEGARSCKRAHRAMHFHAGMCIHACMLAYAGGWADGWTDGWTDASMDGRTLTHARI